MQQERAKIDECTAGWVRAGMLVQVKAAGEIAAMLDADGQYEGLPFMAEMRECYGQHYRVLRSVSRLLVEGVGVRGLRDGVILEGARCNGAEHGGCRRRCHFLWKAAWLSPVAEGASPPSFPSEHPSAGPGKDACPVPPCQGQATVLLAATTPLPVWQVRQYLLDMRAGTRTLAGVGKMLATMLACRLHWGARKVMRMCFRPRKRNSVVPALALRPGEMVEVLSKQEILATLDADGKRGGLLFAEVMWPYCGQRFRVLDSMARMVIEETGEMRHCRDAVILERVTCNGEAFRGCPRGCYWVWKEAWLKRVETTEVNVFLPALETEI